MSRGTAKSHQKDRQCLANKNRQSRSSAPSSINLHIMKSIAVIPKSTTQVFWKTVEAGAREGAKEAGVEMVWKGSLNEDDPAQQIQILEQFVSEGVGGIVLAPIDDTALKRPVAVAMQKGIPVVIMDSALKGEPVKDFVSTVSTNNYRGGEMAGEQLGKLLDGKGKVVLFRFKEGSASTGQREAGFLEAIKKFPDIQVIVDDRYSGTSPHCSHSISFGKLRRFSDVMVQYATFGLSALSAWLYRRRLFAFSSTIRVWAVPRC